MVPACLLSSFVFFGGSRRFSRLLGKYRHFVNLLDSKRYSMSPAVTMWKTNWRWNLTTIQGQQEARIFRLALNLLLVWSSAASDHWPTHRYNRVLRRAFQVMELQACHRVFAPSRRDQDREHILVPLVFALPSWPQSPLWCSWTFRNNVQFS